MSSGSRSDRGALPAPEAARALAESLARMGRRGRKIAVFSMLRDKDIRGVVAAVSEQVDAWFIAPVDTPRAAPVESIDEHVRAAARSVPVTRCGDIAAAYLHACEMATEDDKILVFGSFYTVAAVMRVRSAPHPGRSE